MSNFIDLLNLIETYLPDLQNEIEKYTEYPNQDEYIDIIPYDEEVDKQELIALKKLINERLEKKDKKDV